MSDQSPHRQPRGGALLLTYALMPPIIINTFCLFREKRKRTVKSVSYNSQNEQFFTLYGRRSHKLGRLVSYTYFVQSRSTRNPASNVLTRRQQLWDWLGAILQSVSFVVIPIIVCFCRQDSSQVQCLVE